MWELLVQVHAEVELEGSRGSGGLDGVVDGDGRAQRVEGGVQATVVFFVGFRDQRRHVFKSGEDCYLLAIGMPCEHLVEEPEAFNRCRKSILAARRGQRGGVDAIHITPKSIVERGYSVDWICHYFSFPQDAADYRGGCWWLYGAVIDQVPVCGLASLRPIGPRRCSTLRHVG